MFVSDMFFQLRIAQGRIGDIEDELKHVRESLRTARLENIDLGIKLKQAQAGAHVAAYGEVLGTASHYNSRSLSVAARDAAATPYGPREGAEATSGAGARHAMIALDSPSPTPKAKHLSMSQLEAAEAKGSPLNDRVSSLLAQLRSVVDGDDEGREGEEEEGEEEASARSGSLYHSGSGLGRASRGGIVPPIASPTPSNRRLEELQREKEQLEAELRSAKARIQHLEEVNELQKQLAASRGASTVAAQGSDSSDGHSQAALKQLQNANEQLQREVRGPCFQCFLSLSFQHSSLYLL